MDTTGFLSPDISVLFLMGFFWKKTTSNAALFATMVGLSVIRKFLPEMAVPRSVEIHKSCGT